MANAPSVLLLSDVVDSTRLTARLGDAGMTALWARHDALVRGELARHGGHEHERTDGFLLSLPAVEPALALADALHAGLRALSAELGLEVRSRVVLHRGPVVRVETAARAGGHGARLEGPGRERCEALLALCPGGSTLLSAEAAVGAPGVTDLGWWALSGLPRPIQLFACGSAPSPGPAGRPVSAPARSALLGRERELAELHAALQEGARLLTLLGPGGIGKTRLAREVCENTQIGGACFASLAGVRGPEATLGAVAASLGVPLAATGGADQLGHALAERGALLLVLDNAESALAEVSALSRAWLQRCPELRVLVTSRERLGVPGERVLPLEPLSLEASLALFEARASAALSPTEAQALPALLETLGGLPLGLEIAAAWMGRLSMDRIIHEMHAQELAEPQRGLRSLAATFEASWALLDPEDRESFLRVAVFEGELTEDLLEDALGLDGLDRAFTLADRALLQLRPGRGRLSMLPPLRDFGRNRLARDPALEEDAHRAHATLLARLGEQPHLDALDGPRGGELRAALAERAADLGAAVERASARGWGALATRAALALWAIRRARGPVGDGLAALERAWEMSGLSSEDRQDLRIALAEALHLSGRTPEAERLLREGLAEGPSARIQAALGQTWLEQGHSAEALAAYEEALRDPGALLQRERGAAAQGVVVALHRVGDTDGALARSRPALADAQRRGDRWSEAALRRARAVVFLLQGALDEALDEVRGALAGLEELGERALALRVRRILGKIVQARGELRASAQVLEDALTQARALGDEASVSALLLSLGATLTDLGETAQARSSMTEALALAERAGNTPVMGICWSNLSLIAFLEGDLTRAGVALARARDLLTPEGNLRALQVCTVFEALLLLAEERSAEALQRLEGPRAALPDAQTQGFVSALTGRALGRLGRHAEALAQLEASVRLLRAAADPLHLAYSLATQAEILALAGLPADAPLAEAEALAVALELAPRSQVGIALAQARAALGRP